MAKMIYCGMQMHPDGWESPQALPFFWNSAEKRTQL